MQTPVLVFFCSDRYTDVYGHFPERLRLQLLNETRAMFNFGYDSYMKFAFPLDELDPIHCTGKIIKIYSGGRS
jgi:mannosidase alpha-like ER degradation enhancer 1